VRPLEATRCERGHKAGAERHTGYLPTVHAHAVEATTGFEPVYKALQASA
jgi:hypothetical protein